MRVLYCWNDDFPEAVAAIEKHIPQAEIIDTSANSYAYWDAMEIRWTGVQDLLIVEHDVVVTAEVLPQMLACPEPWCAHSSGGTPFGLRCTRFSARLQQLAAGDCDQGKGQAEVPALRRTALGVYRRADLHGTGGDRVQPAARA